MAQTNRIATTAKVAFGIMVENGFSDDAAFAWVREKSCDMTKRIFIDEIPSTATI